jgi:hypothetical protein
MEPGSKKSIKILKSFSWVFKWTFFNHETNFQPFPWIWPIYQWEKKRKPWAWLLRNSLFDTGTDHKNGIFILYFPVYEFIEVFCGYTPDIRKNEVWLSNDLLLKKWEAMCMVTHIFHWLVIHRIAPAFLLFFVWATVSGFAEPCTPLGPGVVRCGDLCAVPWGSTQVLVTGSFLQWSCLPATVKVRDGYMLMFSLCCSPILFGKRIICTVS